MFKWKTETEVTTVRTCCSCNSTHAPHSTEKHKPIEELLAYLRSQGYNVNIFSHAGNSPMSEEPYVSVSIGDTISKRESRYHTADTVVEAFTMAWEEVTGTIRDMAAIDKAVKEFLS
jgi:hypothetical protein